MRFLFGKRLSRTREEALVWLARLKRGLRPGEGPELLAWLKRRSHRTAIARAAVEWHGPEVLAVLSEIFPIPPALVEPRRRSRPAFLAAAALAGAAITVGVPIAILLTVAIRHHVYTTAQEATRRLTLEDGTLVELNRGTQIEVTYAAQARSLLISRGEVLLKVASEPNSPFYVHAAGRNFETTAATFDVRFTPPHTLSFTVIEGTVRLLAAPFMPPSRVDPVHAFHLRPNQSILLEPLQMLVIEDNEEFGQKVTEQDIRSRLSWQRGT